MEDVGVLVFEVDVEKMNMGDVIDIYLFEGKIINYEIGEFFVEYSYKLKVILDEVCVGGCINLIIGCGFIEKVCEILGLGLMDLFCMFE